MGVPLSWHFSFQNYCWIVYSDLAVFYGFETDYLLVGTNNLLVMHLIMFHKLLMDTEFEINVDK